MPAEKTPRGRAKASAASHANHGETRKGDRGNISGSGRYSNSTIIASEAKQSRSCQRFLDCFVAALLAMTVCQLGKLAPPISLHPPDLPKRFLFAARNGSTRREERPEPVRALRRHEAAELRCPEALVAELVAPGPEPPREMVQAMLVGEADRAMHLVHDV